MVLGLLLLEASVRFLLFSDSSVASRLGGSFRGAWGYATWDTDEYWKLRAILEPGLRIETESQFDPLLGWRSSEILPETYAHREASRAEGRTPVLLYGDSFARCTTEPGDCFCGLLERSDLASTHFLLNYGVGGYGVDQILLLLEASIDPYVARNPVVIVGILVDDDLDRSLLSIRDAPKPRLELGEGGLVRPPPLRPEVDVWLEEHPIGIVSYAWRRIVVGSRLLPHGLRSWLIGEQRRRTELQRLDRAILAAIRDTLESRDVEYFVLVFHGHGSLTGPIGWREQFLLAALADLGMPYVLSRRALVEDAEASGRSLHDYFEWKAARKGHYNAAGNAVVFRCIERGLGGEYDGPP